jgi:ABC-2 type transport system permease protein/oleandomycin transport system permease protein
VTAVTAPLDPGPFDPAAIEERTPVREAVSDALAVARRNLIGLFRVPTTLVFSTVQPVIFVVMFRYVFGGAIEDIPGVRYVDFLMAGIFVQTVTFGATNTGIGLAIDLQTGLMERFRSLPMARSAVLAGRALADVVRNLFVITLMVIVGFLVGFRVHTGVVPFLGAIALLLVFGLAMSWVMALIGLRTGNAEAAQAASFPLMAVLVFASSAFVSTATMPGPLRAYADHQPITATVDAVRALVIGGPTAGKVLVALLWAAGITIVFSTLAVRRYRRSA